jgi:hypothetical protein
MGRILGLVNGVWATAQERKEPVERSQLGQLDTPDVQERGGRDEEGIGPLAPHTFEGGIDLKAGVRVENLDL